MRVKAMEKISYQHLWELDVLRGLAILGMLLFHWFYLLDFWNLGNTDLFTGGWEVFGNTIRNTFFMVVGAGVVLSYQHAESGLLFGLKTTKRGLILIFLGGLITVLSYFFASEQLIRFGVLSFIGTSLILLWPLVFRWYWLALITGLILSLKLWGGFGHSHHWWPIFLDSIRGIGRV